MLTLIRWLIEAVTLLQCLWRVVDELSLARLPVVITMNSSVRVVLLEVVELVLVIKVHVIIFPAHLWVEIIDKLVIVWQCWHLHVLQLLRVVIEELSSGNKSVLLHAGYWCVVNSGSLCEKLASLLQFTQLRISSPHVRLNLLTRDCGLGHVFSAGKG